MHFWLCFEHLLKKNYRMTFFFNYFISVGRSVRCKSLPIVFVIWLCTHRFKWQQNMIMKDEYLLTGHKSFRIYTFTELEIIKDSKIKTKVVANSKHDICEWLWSRKLFVLILLKKLETFELSSILNTDRFLMSLTRLILSSKTIWILWSDKPISIFLTQRIWRSTRVKQSKHYLNNFYYVPCCVYNRRLL